MSRAFLFGDVEPVVVEIKDADPWDVTFMEALGATAVDSILGGIAYALNNEMIDDVSERWPRCEISAKPIETTFPLRHTIVFADEKYL